MDYDYSTILSLIAVGVLWGTTNPFIKKGTSGVERIPEPNVLKRFFKEIVYLITNWKYTLPFIVNQCGSLLYFISLKSAELTVAVPVTNSLAFVFTALTGWLVGEESPDYVTVFGMVLVAIGISCYVLAE